MEFDIIFFFGGGNNSSVNQLYISEHITLIKTLRGWNVCHYDVTMMSL